MEQHQTGDNSPSPHPAENPAAPLIHADPSLSTPNGRELDTEFTAWPSMSSSATNFQHAEKSRLLRFEPPRSKPLFRGFERPSFSRIAILTVLCPTTYPAFYLLTLVARDKSLFIVRILVSAWCSAIGFALGYILLRIGAQHIEAATWATVIHMSYEGGGMKLRDLARGSSNPTSFMPAFHIFRSRFQNRETSRRSRKPYDKRPWTLLLGFFVVLAILGPLLPFLFGRIIVINTFVRNQNEVYREVLIAGDLSQEDVETDGRNWVVGGGDYRMWPTLPYGLSTSDTAELVYGNDIVYFAQPSLSQFVPGGSGIFRKNEPTSISPKGTPNSTVGLTGRNSTKSGTGVILRYSQWGIRIHCMKLPDPEVNLIPLSSQGSTYTLVPRDFLRGLFAVYGMDLPTKFEEFDPWHELAKNDSLPPNIDPSTISWVLKSPENNASVSLDYDVQDGSDQEWVVLEAFLIRISTRHSPPGRFPVYQNITTPSGFRTTVGYDAAVCVLKYEPWVIEAYNSSTGSPSALRIVGKGDSGVSLSPSGKIRGDRIANGTRYLNTTGKDAVFNPARGNGVYQITKDDGLLAWYPTPAAVSFTDGAGPNGYTELSPERLTAIRARFGAVYTLPYFVGSGLVVAHSYEDETLAYTTYKQWQLISLPILVWILGVIGELFVPTLPLNIPRREFGVYSWLALFRSQELRFEAADDLDELMSLEELEEKFSDKRVKFVV